VLTFESEALGESFQVKEPTRAEAREIIFAIRALFQNRNAETENKLFVVTAKVSGLDTSGLCSMDEVHLMDELSMFYFNKGSEGSKKKPVSPSESGSGSTA
jgi:hypothetical protein